MNLRLPAFALLLGALSAKAQTTFNGRPTIIPPTPTAAALEKYGQVPVGTYTGVPNIAVPLYEIKVRDLLIPISLSYHAGGIRVNEEASWVGLGWSLLAGGAITRTVRNLDDLGGFFINHYGNTTNSVFNMPDPTRGADYATDIFADDHTFTGNGFNSGNVYAGAMGIMHSTQQIAVNGQVVPQGLAIKDLTMDWEPDDFRFTAGAYSGQFAFKQDGSLHLLEQQKVNIERANGIWKISTPDGFQYYYSAAENNTSVDPNSLKGTVTTAWYLTRLISPLGEEATFSYDQGGEVRTQPALSQTEVKQYTGICEASAQTNQTEAFGLGYSSPQYLRRISFKTGYVLFDRETARLDLKGAERLSRVSIYDQQDHLLKRYDLQASYFEVPSGSLQTGYATTYTASIDAAYRLDPSYENHRLRLDGVQETGSDGATKPATKFTYNETPLPAKSSFNVDFWGYYNAKQNSTLIPAYAGADLFGKYTQFSGADRTPDSTAMQAGLLRKITYPTGGSTTYTFEPHYYGNLSTEDNILPEGRGVNLRFDNTNPGYTILADTIKLTVASPVKVIYDISVRDPSSNASINKSETGLWLMDKSTGKVYTTGSVTYQDQYQAIWTFTDQERTNNSVQRTAGSALLVLPPGTYYFKVLSPGAVGAGCPVTMTASAEYSSITHLDESDNISKMAGGLRIRRVEEIDGLDARRNQVATYQYGFRGLNRVGKPAFKSSGVIISRPVFKKTVHYSLGSTTDNQGVEIVAVPCGSLQLTSYSNVCFSAGAKGSTVGYQQVNVLQGPHGEGGKTEYSFHCLEDRTLEYEVKVPNVPTRSDDLNGYPLVEATYRWSANGYQQVNRKEYRYESPDDRYHYDLPGMARGSSWIVHPGDMTVAGPLTVTYFYYYPIPVRWVRLQQTTTTTYDPADESKYVATSTRYTYDTLNVGHRQVSQTRTVRSDGSTLLTHTRYPADYQRVTSGPLAAMRSDAVFQHAAPVETLTQVYGPGQSPADAKTLSGTYTEYVPAGPAGRYQPGILSGLELARPTPGLNATLSGSLPPAGRYVPHVQLSYDLTTGNVQQVRRLSDVPTTYLWGYDNTLPVAKIDNASAAQTQAALTALGWNPNIMASDAQLQANLTRLRQRLPQALLTGFTYRPLVGITSQTDPTGRTTTYEYDALGRLVRTRDERGRILSQQQYHYAQH